MRFKGKLSVDEAETIAVDALGFIARDIETLGRFLALTGLGPAEIRAAASDPSFLVGVLEFMLEDESRVLAFSTTRGVRPTLIAAARFTLAGHYDLDATGLSS